MNHTNQPHIAEGDYLSANSSMMCFSTNAGEVKAEGKFLEEEHQSKQDL
jgi:hypothetical protein